uniref:DUF834 domain-containing protein n=1 Tax=Oryza glumipatula TaxID=40148 RepID=A0A0E0BQN0_9ORYZ
MVADSMDDVAGEEVVVVADSMDDEAAEVVEVEQNKKWWHPLAAGGARARLIGCVKDRARRANGGDLVWRWMDRRRRRLGRRHSGGQSCDAARWRLRQRFLGGPESCDARRAQPRWTCDGRRACGNGDTRWAQPRRTSYGNDDDLGPQVLIQEGLGRGRGIYGRRRAVCGESNRGRGTCGGSGRGDPALPPLPLSDPVVTLPSPLLQATSAPSSLEAATTMATGGGSGGSKHGCAGGGYADS